MALKALRLIAVLDKGNGMRDDVKHTKSNQTERASHWLHDEPETFDEAKREVERLQRTIMALVVIGLITEGKAAQAYYLAGWDNDEVSSGMTNPDKSA